MDSLTHGQRKSHEALGVTNLKIFNFLSCGRSADAFAFLEKLNYQRDSISLSSENWNLFGKYQTKLKVLDKIDVIEDSVEEIVFEPIKLSNTMKLKAEREDRKQNFFSGDPV